MRIARPIEINDKYKCSKISCHISAHLVVNALVVWAIKLNVKIGHPFPLDKLI